MFRRLVLVDLDGVLNEYNGKYDKNIIPNKKAGVERFLETIIDMLDCDIKIFTTRPKNLTLKWIKENKLDKYIKDVTNIKEPAYLIIDDRCIKHNNFEDTLKEIIIFQNRKN